MKKLMMAIALTAGLTLVATATPFSFSFGGGGGIQDVDLSPTFEFDAFGMDLVAFDSDVTPSGDDGFLFRGSGRFENPSDKTDYVQFSFSGVSDSDPFINWGYAVTTGSKGVKVVTSFSQPTVGSYTIGIAGFNGSLGVVKRGQLAVTNLQTDNQLDGSTLILLPLLPGTCDWGIQNPGINKPCPVDGTQFGPKTKFFGAMVDPLMKTVLSFDVTANTSATFNGQFILSNVPEPAGFALLGAGLLALATLGRRRLGK